MSLLPVKRVDAAFQEIIFRVDEERPQFPVWKILSEDGYLYLYGNLYRAAIYHQQTCRLQTPNAKGDLFISQDFHVWKIQVLQRKQPKQKANLFL